MTKIKIKKEECTYLRKIKLYELEVDGIAIKASKTWESDNEFGDYEQEHEIENEVQVEALLNDIQLEELHDFLNEVQ